MTAAPIAPLAADRATRRRRRLRAARTLAGISVRTRLLPVGRPQHRQRRKVCAAADVLTALGVRVQVLVPPKPWPRGERVIVSDHTGWLGDLAVTTAVRGGPVITGGPGAPPGAAVCGIAVRYRLEGDGGYLAGADLPRTVSGIAALPGLVVEVHCLPVEAGAAAGICSVAHAGNA